MAYFVMNGGEWAPDRIDRAYDSSANRHVPVDDVDVQIVYWTAWADAEGIMHFHDDIYGKDTTAVEAQVAPVKDTKELAAN